jgi:recombination protein RecT
MSTALTVQQKVTAVRDLLKKAESQIAVALPRHCTPERMLRVAMTAIQRTPKLLDCDPKTLIGAIVQASQLGLEPDGVLGHAYLVPFRNSKTGRDECQLIPGYKGLVDLSRRSGQVSTVYAQVVHEKDVHSFSYGLKPELQHIPSNLEDPGPLVAVYAVANLRDGGVQFEWMWKRQVDAIRKRSRAGNSGPWVTDYEEMAKKTVLRRLCKLLPVSVELQQAVALDEHAEAGIPQRLDAVVNFGGVADQHPGSLDALTSRLNGDTGGDVIDDDGPYGEDERAADADVGDQGPSEADMLLDQFHLALDDATTPEAVLKIRGEVDASSLPPALKEQALNWCAEREKQLMPAKKGKGQRSMLDGAGSATEQGY